MAVNGTANVAAATDDDIDVEKVCTSLDASLLDDELRAMLKSYRINIDTSETMKYFKAALRKKQMEPVMKDSKYRRAWSAWYSDADREELNNPTTTTMRIELNNG